MDESVAADDAPSGKRSIAAATRADGVLQVRRPGTEWLHTGWHGGLTVADAAYNVTVPEGWAPSDIGTDVDERLATASFTDEGPVLLTGVEMSHVRGANCGPVTAYATVGISNPAVLPADPAGGSLPSASVGDDEESTTTGTANLVVVTDRSLAAGALANLVAVAAEAKTATLLAETGFPGTTSDAITVGHDPTGETARYSGSATRVGAATRACVREAVTASLHSRYEDGDADRPQCLADAAYGVSTDVRADVFAVPSDRR
ncbi:hypothetical protein Halru_2358 [Halovivax ruber XH-70]|uniref:Adenosylcobinamide amidohydrolase n=1 Tax=Halovivax ruber (strain DSM 18193 / JCM 13892 / XH-70) TaxID=797302 RepID=L0IDN5_HALRX|nr:adenosylcobinamide amidohydrolase [Halovivax ruber]AGB16943.1 hypothetical protein Halru_2358 [Halovivax ruber XH-70]